MGDAHRLPDVKNIHMELLLVFLSTAIGTVVGVAAVMMMQRKDRKTAVGAGSVLRTQLQNTEWALASAGRDVEELRRKLDEHEQSGQNTAQELESTRRRLMDATIEAEKESARRAEAEHLAADATGRVETLSERVRQLETASSESAEAQSRILVLEAELARLRQAASEADVRNSALGQELAECRQKSDALASEVAGFASERAALQAVIRKHRELNAEGMELLRKLQEKLAGEAQEDQTDANKPTVNGFAFVG